MRGAWRLQPAAGPHPERVVEAGRLVGDGDVACEALQLLGPVRVEVRGANVDGPGVVALAVVEPLGVRDVGPLCVQQGPSFCTFWAIFPVQEFLLRKNESRINWPESFQNVFSPESFDPYRR